MLDQSLFVEVLIGSSEGKWQGRCSHESFQHVKGSFYFLFIYNALDICRGYFDPSRDLGCFHNSVSEMYILPWTGMVS